MGQTKRFAILVAACALSATAQAQSQAGVTAPNTAGAAPPADDGPPLPGVSQVSDPMLVPVAPAANTLVSWRDALRLVRQRSTALHIAHADVQQAEGEKRRALAHALPTLTGNGNLTRYLLLENGVTNVGVTNLAGAPVVTTTNGTLPDPATRLSASLDLRQPIFNLGAWYGVGTAKERVRGAELSESDTQRQLLGIVAQSIVSVITATRVTESSRSSLAFAISTRDLTKKRAELGAASAVDVLRAEQEVAQSRAQIVTGDEQLREARESLGSALGDTQGWNVSPDIKLDDLRETAAQVCVIVDGIETRSDIQAATSNVKAAQRDRTSVDYTYFPTLDLFSSLSYLNAKTISPNGDHVNWTVGGQLVWPLFDGGDRYGLARVNDASVTIAKEQLTQKRRDATLQIIQADRSIVVAQANVDVATMTRDLAKESARLARLAFINGSGTSFDLVDNARKLREAEIDLLIKDFQVFQAKLTAFLARTNCAI